MKNTQKVFAVHPGWCKTDMGTDNGKQNAPRSSMEGATFICNLLEGDQKSGGFYFEERESNYDTCK